MGAKRGCLVLVDLRGAKKKEREVDAEAEAEAEVEVEGGRGGGAIPIWVSVYASP